MKYKLTEETLTLENGKVLHRIQALKDFADVKAGDLGGWIESEFNLSQEGNCWVYGEAQVFDYAIVYSNAKVKDHSKVFENAGIYDNAVIRDYANMAGHSVVEGYALVAESASIFGYAKISNNAFITESARIFGYAKVKESAIIAGAASIHENAIVRGTSYIQGSVNVKGNIVVNGFAELYEDAIVSSMGDYMVFQNTWSSGRFFTWTKSNNMWKVGCFYGTGQELIEKAYKDSQRSGDCYKACVELVEKLNLA